VAREGAEGAQRLRALVGVVGKDQIDAAAVDVELGAQVAPRHGRALDVPARAARAPRRRPRRLTGLGRLPQREVERRPLLFTDIDARAGLELVERLLRERPV